MIGSASRTVHSSAYATFFNMQTSSASTDADIRIDRRRHTHRPTQTYAPPDADMRIDRRRRAHRSTRMTKELKLQEKIFATICNKHRTAAFTKYKNISKTYKITLPMKYFTQEELQPSEKTLSFIRQIAYSYRLAQANNRNKPYCVS